MDVNSLPVRGRRSSMLFIIAALVALALVFAGFARTYYLKVLFGGATLGGMVHLHGALMTAWFLLFFTQATLIKAKCVRMHRRLGVAGALLAAAVVVVGTYVAIDAAARGVAPPVAPPLVFLAIPLVDMFLFAFFVGAALCMRRYGDWHKRLMLLGTLAILPAAIARIPLDFIGQGGPLIFFGLTDIVIAAIVVCDTAVNRRLHPAFGWGLALVVLSHPLRLLMAGTGWWMSFALWLTGLN